MQPSNERSYPSGHAINGYLAALVRVDVMTGNGAPAERDRTNLLIARGVRYGTNRVICGVHYPSDVLNGQLFARFLFARIRLTDDYKADLACARLEDVNDRCGQLGDRTGYSADCKARADAYAVEKH